MGDIESSKTNSEIGYMSEIKHKPEGGSSLQ